MRPKIVDLFCGAGGFSLGAHNAGFDSVLAADVDPLLAGPVSKNLGAPYRELNLGEVAEGELADLVGCRPDAVVGGPPCQGFSEIGRSDKSDARNELVGHYYRHVAKLEPRFFIMENVRGIMFEHGLGVLKEALKKVEDKYDIVGPVLLDASKHGAPTKRPRVVVVGIHKSEKAKFSKEQLAGNGPSVTVREAIADLSYAKPAGVDADGFDTWDYGCETVSPYARAARTQHGVLLDAFTGHAKVAHTPAVVERFGGVAPGSIDPVGRHFRLAWAGFAPTIRAGTGSDKGSYQSVRPIHPDEPRVITVREAARLQGFPDWYRFHPTVWHSFRMIGNSVPPPVAESLIRTVWGALDPAVIGDAEPRAMPVASNF